MFQISITQLFEENREKLGLTWKAGRDNGDKQVIDETVSQTNQGVIGHLNFVHPNWIQVLSSDEADYLNQLDPISLQHNMQRLAQSGMSCIIATGGIPVPDSLSALADSTRTPILCSERSSLEVMWLLRPYLWRVLAPSDSMHGVLLDVLGMGVMITGESGVDDGCTTHVPVHACTSAGVVRRVVEQETVGECLDPAVEGYAST